MHTEPSRPAVCRAGRGVPAAGLAVALCLGLPSRGPAQDGALERFERSIRPVLVERCYECHSTHGKRKGGLALDHRDGLLRGGDSGPALVAGDAAGSLLIAAIRQARDDLRMPEGGPKLDARVIAEFVRWIDAGAADPRDRPPAKAELEATLSWEAQRERRKRWWSFQPVTDPPVPAVRRAGWSPHAIDRFVLARLEAAGLGPPPRADRATQLRRLSFVLTGLPPDRHELAAFLADEAPGSYERQVDRLLASPRFGERWARHWMDWVRYADSHGSEGDPAIPHAFRFRDYLIRALNAGVPFDRLVREQVAGDLLPQPRVDAERGIVESRLGPAQLRLVQHGFAPTDALEEQVRFIDDQIDVLGKAFLGLTVSCARCHDHKFDAIGQDDYYALFGVLASSRPALVAVDTDARLQTGSAALAAAKARVQAGLAAAWQASIDALPARFAELDPKERARAAGDPRHPLHAWQKMTTAAADARAATWDALRAEYAASRQRLATRRYPRRFDLTQEDDYRAFVRHGAGMPARPAPAGAFHVEPDGDRILETVLPAGVYSHMVSDKHNGVLSSPRFPFDAKAIFVRVAGDGGAQARYVVQGYPRRGTVYPIAGLRGGAARWIRWDVDYWRGDAGYVEVSTAADQPVEANTSASRSWFGLGEVVFVSEAQLERGEVPRDEVAEVVAPLFAGEVAADDPVPVYQAALRRSVQAWVDGGMTDAQARFLGGCVRAGLLPSTLGALPQLAAAVRDYRALEAAVPVPTRAPGVLDAAPRDQPLMIRGDHRKPGAPVPRRFLAALDDTPYGAAGRLQLARDLTRPDNPLAARVAVNRLWHHVFGRGIVATPDNFGRLGAPPTHPALLDHLAARFIASGWSIKGMLRALVTTETFRMSGRGGAAARAVDPDNALLSRFRVRRLEAEAIRDALLAVSGRLDAAMYGPGVQGTSDRRSVYVRVQRNQLDPFLHAFDAPEPHTTCGSRDATNVPAQALALLNDPFVVDRARSWADAVLRDRDLADDRQRLNAMFVAALGRAPAPGEVRHAEEYLAALRARDAALVEQVDGVARRLAPVELQIQDLVGRVRARVTRYGSQPGAGRGPEPIAAWEFEGDLRDAVGGLHGVARGSARVADGALVLDGRGHVETGKLDRALRAKTLEAWVVLADVQQRGGGVLGVQTPDGGVFDAVVFGEKDPGQWLPGSDNFRRTQGVGGPVEVDAQRRAVHVAVTWAADGTVTAFREGRPYGRSYRTGGPVRFDAGGAVVLFGLRHAPPGGNRHLRGRILRARLYDRALTADEVLASYGDDRGVVSLRQLREAMTRTERFGLEHLERRAAALRAQLSALGEPAGYAGAPALLWRDYAWSLFNLKEFIYLR